MRDYDLTFINSLIGGHTSGKEEWFYIKMGKSI
jgi:hypothetical protein